MVALNREQDPIGKSIGQGKYGKHTPDLYLDFCSSTVLYALTPELLNPLLDTFKHPFETDHAA